MHQFFFYVLPENIHATQAIITADEYHHCCQVLRKKVGDTLTLFDGSGRQFHAQLIEISKNSATAKILDNSPYGKAPNPSLKVGIALLKPKAMEQIIHFASSLGVAEFFPLSSKHSQIKHFNRERFVKIALESIKQCGNLYMPLIHQLSTLDNWLSEIQSVPLKIVAEITGDNLIFLQDKIQTTNEIAFLVGPEGGFTETELTQICQANFSPVKISEYRLRAELASVVLISNILLLHQRREA
jgi:16S rRNA (uracil1498-N3)-methyltransferase